MHHFTSLGSEMFANVCLGLILLFSRMLFIAVMYGDCSSLWISRITRSVEEDPYLDIMAKFESSALVKLSTRHTRSIVVHEVRRKMSQNTFTKGSFCTIF